MARIGRERILAAGVFLLPLVWWPQFAHPFSTPKLWLLGALGLAILADSRVRKSVQWQILLWPAAAGISAAFSPLVSMEAFLLAILPVPLFLAVRAGLIGSERLKAALFGASLVEAAVAVLQFAGLDPLRLAGFSPEAFGSSRMRVYGTLGNPDFVAAWLCATLPLHFDAPGGGDRRDCPRGTVSSVPPVRFAALGLHIAAILATGSRVPALALPAAAGVALLCRMRPGKRWLAAALAAAAAVTVVCLSPARPLATTLEGRFYLARIAAGHLAGTPPAGWGPGSFELKFAPWQVEWLRERGTPAAAIAFAGPVDHAHNDFLEFWVEYGALGVMALLGFCGWVVFRGWSARQAAVWSAAASLLAISFVDFPFHRPAEWALFWLLMGAAAGPTACPPAVTGNNTRRNERCLDS